MINITLDDSNQLIAKLELLESNVQDINKLIAEFLTKHPLENVESEALLRTPKERILQYVKKLNADKVCIQDTLNGTTIELGLTTKLKQAKVAKTALISTADGEEKRYQKYLADTSEWENQRNAIIGNETTENSLIYFQSELDYLNKQLDADYEAVKEQRDAKIKELFALKGKLVGVYEQIYSPIENEIAKLLGD